MKDLRDLLIGWLILSLLGGALLLLTGCTFNATHQHTLNLKGPRGPVLPGPICVGDTVRLRSGGVLMTVRRIDWGRGQAQCEWIGTVVGLPHRAWFDLHLLQREAP